MARILVVLALLTLVTGDPPSRLTGEVRVHTVVGGDTLTTLSARFGVELATLARDNSLAATAKLRAGDRLTIDNRHLAPQGFDDGVVLNVPQRMLFVFVRGRAVRGFPIAVGRADWRTPIGAFAVAAKEIDPVWDVPPSIQREMARAGKRVLTHVRPGPGNPLGSRWIGLTLPAVGIHGTNAPASIYRFTTHGCIRMHPDDVLALFDMVQVGTPVHILYEPVLVLDDPTGVFVEVHADVYRRAGSLQARLDTLLDDAGLQHLRGSSAMGRVVSERVGRAVLVAK